MSGVEAISVHLADFAVAIESDDPPTCGAGEGLLRWLVGAQPVLTADGLGHDFRSWTVFGMWSAVDAACAALERTSALFPWMEGAEHQWHGVAGPTRAIGTSNHTLDGSVGSPAWDPAQDVDQRGGFVVSITTAAYDSSADADPERVKRFVKAQFHLTNSAMVDVPGSLGHRDFSSVPRGVFDGGNLTLWSDLGSMNAFAFRAGEHRTYVDSHRETEEGWFDRSSFSRFRLISAKGTMRPWCQVQANLERDLRASP